MLSAERRLHIADELQQHGLATVRELAERLKVSEVTIRRDLGILEEEGGILRIHGGAMARRHGTASEPLWGAKRMLRKDAKDRIGRAAAARIQPGETVVLDSGTTTFAVAEAIEVPCSVVVVDVQIALELAAHPRHEGIQVLVVGGEVRRGLFSTTGHFALEMLSQLHVDRAFLSADAVDIRAGVTNATVQGTAVKKAIVDSANEVVLVADASKLGLVALSTVAPLSALDVWITDSSLTREALDDLRAAGLQVEVV